MLQTSNYNKYIQLNNVTVSYEKFGNRVIALDNVSLSVSKGEWVYIIGPNGSGKTTLLKSIAKQVEIDQGTIVINERNLNVINSKDLASTLFYVNQNPMLGSISQMTIWENLIATDIRNKRIKRNNYEALLKDVGLLEHKHHLVHFLSGGQRQILTLLIAQMRNADILLLDEPASSLDPVNAEITRQIINKMYDSNKTILYVTHQERIISNSDKRIIKLDKGKLYE